MPNRLIKESICTSEEIDALTPEQEVLFYRLIVNADDYGLMDARPAILKSRCYPLKSIDIRCMQADINRLIEVGLIKMYEVEKRPYLSIVKWASHQQIRAKKPKFPMPEQGCANNGYQLISDASKCPRNPIQSNPISLSVVVADEQPSPSAEERPTHTADKQPPARPRLVSSSKKICLPEGWEPSEDGKALAKRLGLPPDEPERFRDHWLSNGGKKCDWDATWRNWCKRSVTDFNRNSANGYGQQRSPVSKMVYI